ncbi:MAG: UbiD family decarboxylase [Pseudonocardia sp.]|nr:UbiD family decarboxylase [Pseudonocardia sp.]
MAVEWGLRGFLDELDEAGELARVTESVSLREVGALIDECPQALLFSEIAGCGMPLVANVMASRRRLAVALGVPPTEIRAEIGRRLECPRPPRTVALGPVKDVRLIGDQADLTLLPIHLQHALDGAPFLSAPMDVTRHPDSGRYNVGVRRLMLRGPRQTGVDVVSPSDLRGAYRRARELEQRLEVAFVIGAHPVDYLATQLRVPCEDEFHLMGALRGEPVPLVECETVDLRVPSDAEVVVEGYLEGDWTNLEGPYGEYTGYYGAAHRNPLFQVTAITHRADAVFQTATIGGRNSWPASRIFLHHCGKVSTEWPGVNQVVRMS